MERAVQLVLGLALLVFVVQSGAAETDDLTEPTAQLDAPADEHDADLASNDVLPDAPTDEGSEDLSSEDDYQGDHDDNKCKCGNSGSGGTKPPVSKQVSYRYSVTPAVTWFHAEETCRVWGGHLATHGMRNYEERRKIMKTLQAKGFSYWVGLHDLTQKGCYEWIDGKGGRCATTKTIFWIQGEPYDHYNHNERCGEIRGYAYKWKMNNLNCKHKRAGVCEIPIVHH